MMREVDTDGSGTIGLEEFCKLMISRVNDADDPKVMKEAFKIFDDDGSGEISQRAHFSRRAPARLPSESLEY